MIQIPAMRERCAAIDVGKQEFGDSPDYGSNRRRRKAADTDRGTTVPALELKVWLIQEHCTSVAMESTSYWIPVKNALEEHMEIVLVSARTHQPKKGDKTDLRDAAHLAHLHRHAMLQGSYLPECEIVELRDLTRRRKKLLGNLGAEKNGIQKILEVANVKIGNVVSDVFGVFRTGNRRRFAAGKGHRSDGDGPRALALAEEASAVTGNPAGASAGKSKNSHIKKANKFLLATLVQAAWGAVRARG
jgi:Transposase